MEMHRDNSIHHDINTLAAYCGPRDIHVINQNDVRRVINQEQADVFVLFGGSILAGCDVLAEAMQQEIARTYIIVGGAGHTTQALRDKVHAIYPDIETEDRTEAYLFNELLKKKYGLTADYLEVQSTNCGNNITYLLDLLQQENIECNSIILCQDATMQRRMSATLRKYKPGIKIINYASYVATLDDELNYTQEIFGMWEFERYLSLLMGEIPRLTDNEEGYGPRGKGFIAHEDVPTEVTEAFHRLRELFSDLVRVANPAYASIVSKK